MSHTARPYARSYDGECPRCGARDSVSTGTGRHGRKRRICRGCNRSFYIDQYVAGERSQPITNGPPCPACASRRTVKHGRQANRRNAGQRRKCRECGHVFLENHAAHKRSRAQCIHCGELNTLRNSKPKRAGGQAVRCNNPACAHFRGYFQVGGRAELTRHYWCLRQKVYDLSLPEDVTLELLALACEAVLDGEGDCWNVPLPTGKAWAAARGEFGQRGSDHPAFQRQNDQKHL